MRDEPQHGRREPASHLTYQRRTLLRAALAAATLSAGGSLLAACGGSSPTPTTGTSGAAGGSATTTTAATATTKAGATSATTTLAGTMSTATTTAPGSPSPATRATTSAGGTPVGSPVAVDGKIPSPAPGVPDAYTKLPAPFKSSTGAPGKGGKVTSFVITYDPPTPPREQNLYWQELEKRLGVTYEPTIVPRSSYEEKLAAVTVSSDLPDFVFLTPPPGTEKLILQGAYTDLTPYLTGAGIKDYPNLAKFPEPVWNHVRINKKVYGVPRPRFLGNDVMIYRQDWADKVGIANPKNADEFFNLMVAWTKNDPDGNGKVDSYGLTSTGPRPDFNVTFFNQMFRAPNGWRRNGDGSLTADIETDEYRQALTYARRLFEAGIYHPDAATMTSAQANDAFNGSRVGATYIGLINLFGSGGRRQQIKQFTPTADVAGVVPMGHDGGKAVYYESIGYFGYTGISAKAGKDRERLQELLRIMNYLASPFGSEENIFLSYGIEGVHHTKKPDGTLALTDRGKQEIGVLSGPQGILAGLTNPPPVAFYDVPGDAQRMQQLQQNLLAIGIENPTWGFFSPTNAAKGGELNQLRADRLLAVVTGREPLTAWDQLVKDWRSRGGDQIRKEYEEAMKA